MGYRYVVQVFDGDGLVGWLRKDHTPTFDRRARGSWGTRSGAEGAAVLTAAKNPDLIGYMTVKRRTMEEVVFDHKY